MTDDKNNSRADYLKLFTAENVLGGSPFLENVLRLRDTLSRSSDGNIVDYDAAALRLRDEVKDLPTLELQVNVPAGSESVYQRQLLHALEKINEDHDRVSRKLMKIKSRLVSALTMMKNQRAQFKAYFSLAFPVAIHTASIPNMKLSVKDIGEVAAGEYSRVMDNLDNAAISTLSEIELLELEIKSRKQAAASVYQLGKDQVNLIWNSFQANGAIGMDDNPGALLKTFPVEDDGDEIPSFVSRHTKEVRFGASIKRPEPLALPEPQAEVKGTFFKQGDPQPVTPIVDDDGEIRVVTLESVGTFTLPERKEPPEYPVEVTIGEWSPSRLLELAEEEEKAELGPVLAASPEIYEEIKAQNEEPVAVVVNGSVTTDSPVVNQPVPFTDKQFWIADSNPTTSVLIEDIEDSPPHFMQEASKLMEDATLGVPVVEFKPVLGKALTVPEAPSILTATELEALLNEPNPLATPAPLNPRKKLALLDEDEL
jgi:hypothetical protein